MFMRRRRHGGGLLGLILALLGFRVLSRACSMKKEQWDEVWDKSHLFRSKLKEAFDVWKAETVEEAQAAKEAVQGAETPKAEG